MNDLFRPLRNPVFASMWGATLLANLGFWVQDTALGWLISGLTSSPSQVALVPAMTLFPAFLLSLPAGALGDSVDRRKLLIAVQMCLVLALLGFAAVLAMDRLSVAAILIFAFVSGSLNAISGPTRQAVLPSIVAPQEVRSAVMLSSIGFNGSRAIGPMIGGVALALFGPMTAVLSYAMACMIVGLVLFLWKSPKHARMPIRIWPDIAAGLKYVFRQPELRKPLLASALFFVLVSPLWAFAPLVAKGFAAGNSSIFGVFMMAIGLGSVLGGFNRHLNGSAGFASALRIGSVLLAIAFTIIAFSTYFLLSIGGFLLAGIGWIGVSAGINSHMLLRADPSFRTRSISIVMIIFSGGLTLGSLVWGQFGRLFGIGPAFATAAGLLGLMAVITVWRRTRTADLPAC